MDSYNAIKYLATTEKGADLAPLNKYIFVVDKCAGKQIIKRAVEELYKVKVAAVNITVSRGKKRRVRYKAGKTADRKKAIVTLKQGHKIEIATT